MDVDHVRRGHALTGDVMEQRDDIDRRDANQRGAADREEPIAKRGRAIELAERIVETLHRCLRGALASELDVAADRHQHIIQVMRHAPGEHADGLVHARIVRAIDERSPRRFRAHARRQIDQAHAQSGTVIVETTDLHQYRAPLGMLEHDLGARSCFARDGQNQAQIVEVRGRDERIESMPRDVALQLEQRVGGRIRCEKVAASVDDDRRSGRALEARVLGQQRTQLLDFLVQRSPLGKQLDVLDLQLREQLAWVFAQRRPFV